MKLTVSGAAVLLFMTGCTMNEPEQRIVAGAAVGAVLGAATGNNNNILPGAVAGGIAGALSYGQRPGVGASQCQQQYRGNPGAIRACLEGVERGLVQQAREVGRSPTSTRRTCYGRYSGTALSTCLREVDNRQARTQRSLERDARRAGQNLGYNM